MKGYRCLDIKTGCVHTSRHVVFDETSFPFLDTPTSFTIFIDNPEHEQIQISPLVFPFAALPSSSPSSYIQTTPQQPSDASSPSSQYPITPLQSPTTLSSPQPSGTNKVEASQSAPTEDTWISRSIAPAPTSHANKIQAQNQQTTLPVKPQPFPGVRHSHMCFYGYINPSMLSKPWPMNIQHSCIIKRGTLSHLVPLWI